MNLQEFYAASGGGYEEAIGRLRSEALIKKFVLRFPDDPSFSELKAALEADDTQGAFHAAHTLKGVCANLSLAKLAGSASEITEHLRGGDLAAAKELWPEVEADYAAVVEAVRQIG